MIQIRKFQESSAPPLVFGERSDPPRNLRVPDFRDLGSRPRTSRPRNLPRARIKNSQRPPQNTRNKGNLIFHSYSKTDVRAPCAPLVVSSNDQGRQRGETLGTRLTRVGMFRRSGYYVGFISLLWPFSTDISAF